MASFFRELKRRNVYKVAAAYVVVGWLLIQIATQVFPFFEIPNWAVRLVVLLLALGFPVAVIIAWAFELTPEGIKKSEDVPLAESIAPRTGRNLWAFTAVAAVAAATLFAAGFFFRGETTPAPPGGPNTIEKSIAVLPFENLSSDKENSYFADGIQDEILT